MSSLKTSPRNRLSLRGWSPQRLVLPYVLSMAAHASILLVLATTVRSCHQSPAGFGGDPNRPIGIVVEREGNRLDAQVPGDPNDVEPGGTSLETTIVPANDQLAPTQATTETPPAEVMLPSRSETPAVIGAGATMPAGGGAGILAATTTAGVADPREQVRSQGGQRPAARGTRGGVLGAGFMGSRDEGMKVVFVVDASGSMTSHNAMQVAKNALMSSLQALDERQQFLIIFYDDKPQVIKLHDEAKPTLTVASELNKTLARQKISGIQPGSGTDHLPPLEMAIRLSPDVIFFLTDALEPPLWPKDLEKIRTMNGGRVRIHSIEFGQGPELGTDADLSNFLRKLAHQNGGTYRYHDVTRFKAP